jgi:hypothetical protein
MPKPRAGRSKAGGELAQLLQASTVVVPNDGPLPPKADAVRDALTEQTLRERETQRLGFQKYYDLRDKWSRYIMLYVWFMLLFQLGLTLAIGLTRLDFGHYSFFLNLVIGQNFAQIVGMGIIVAKFLFSDQKPSV